MKRIFGGMLLAMGAISFVSCDDPNEVGLNLQADDQLLGGALVDTITLNTHVLLENSGITSEGSSITAVGSYVDSEFGTITARSFTQLIPANDEFDFGTGVTCDSAVLYLENFITTASGLDPEPYIYGDSTKTQTIEAYAIASTWDEDSTYQTTSSLSVESTPLASLTFTPAPNSTTAISMNLGCDFGDRLIQNGSSTEEQFVIDVPGIMLQPADGIDASILGFNSLNDSTRVILYYHNDTDTTSLSYEINSSSKRFNQFSADRSSTQIASLLASGDSLSTSLAGNVSYIQSGTGVRTLVRFPGLDHLIATEGQIAINLARLIITPVDGSFTGLADEVPNVLATFEAGANGSIAQDENGDDIWIEADERNIVPSLDGLYSFDEDEGKYELVMTGYFQDLVDGTRANTGLVISGVLNSTHVRRTVVYDGDTTVNGDNAMKLELFYSKLQ